MRRFFDSMKNKNVHIVGLTGAEASSILRLLTENNVKNITGHDLLKEGSLEKSYNTWHKNIPIRTKKKEFNLFAKTVNNIKFYSGKNYLTDVQKADAIFVPQSWRLYQENKKLRTVSQNKKIPFYSLTGLYLKYAEAFKIAVTGTVGKGSTAYILVQLLRKSGKTVYFAGNESWMSQAAEKLPVMKKTDILVLEISHRQLIDGFDKSADIVLVTNILPNHLDEVSWNEYIKLKMSLIKKQNAGQTAVLNYDDPVLRQEAKTVFSKAIYYSIKYIKKNTKSIQKIFPDILSTKNTHYPINILAASTVAVVLGIKPAEIVTNIKKISVLRDRLCLVQTISGINVYSDLKSTTPWATLKALEKIENPIIICGGYTKGIDYSEFVQNVNAKVKNIIIIKSGLSEQIGEKIKRSKYLSADNFSQALRMAYSVAKKQDSILISPAAAYFYSKFLKGKAPLKKQLTSLFPAEIKSEAGY